MERRPQRWGGIELGAAALMTAGMVLIPLVGPVVGLGLAWLSSYWTRREKLALTAFVLVLVGVSIALGVRPPG